MSRWIKLLGLVALLGGLVFSVQLPSQAAESSQETAIANQRLVILEALTLDW